ncbi:RNA polymerase subunit sigma-70 [Actinomycetospora endophytica]|uniref:RNA polymerase subunit sigma-70 n=1 Tax=Actinomycetospora endophytica TaxID=2291215 RepID=A0ABS8P158_9PSEU|nr:RNA polymerase subunit sigma-70 [Actinomycetospora endophytica]MCD2191980.1 RNA polymerase subunit sigma-70 [Actinomycetospora endophytica]
MSQKKAFAQLRKALDALESADGPRERLSAVRRLRQTAEELEGDLVEEARSAGLRWSDIGELYGTSKQGVQQRFRRRIGKAAE